jgi:hypothetical protein
MWMPFGISCSLPPVLNVWGCTLEDTAVKIRKTWCVEKFMLVSTWFIAYWRGIQDLVDECGVAIYLPDHAAHK